MTPSIVVPAGEHTASFSSLIERPSVNAIVAAPFNVCAAYTYACLRGMPNFTAASASASMNKNAYAGPLPLTAVTPSINFSATCSTFPAVERSAVTVAISSALTSSAGVSAVIASPTVAGRFGIILMKCGTVFTEFESGVSPHDFFARVNAVQVYLRHREDRR